MFHERSREEKLSVFRALRDMLRRTPPQDGGAADGAGPRAPVLAPDPQNRHQPFPLMDIQEAYLVGKQLGDALGHVGGHFYMEIEEQDLDAARLERAWQRLVAHHEMLRAKVLPEGRQQIMAAAPAVSFPVHDLRWLTAAEIERHRADVRLRLSHKLYEAGSWPLFDVEISRLPGDRSIIHFSLDTWVTDGAGLHLLQRQWFQLYREPGLELAGLDVSFRDVVLAIKEFEKTPRFREDLAYWLGKFADMPSGPKLPMRVRAGSPTATAASARARLHRSLPPAAWRAMKSSARSAGVSPTTLLLTLFAETLSRWSGDEPYALVLTFFNRPPLHPRIDEIVGPFISTSLFKVEPPAGRSLVEQARLHQRQLWDDMDHYTVSGVRTLRELRLRSKAERASTLPVVFTSMLDNAAKPADAEDWFQRVSYAVTQTPQVALDHQILERDGELYLSWDYDAESFEPGVVEAMFDRYGRAVAELAEHPERWRAERPAADPPAAPSRPEAVPARAAPPPLAHDPALRHQLFGLTDLQQAYFVGRTAFLEHGGVSCQLYLEYACEGLDVPRLERALRAVVATHDMLRAVIDADGRCRVLEDAPPYEIRSVDLRGDASPESALSAVRQRTSEQVFPLGRWPLFEVAVSRLDATRWHLHVAIDLLIADGNSVLLVLKQWFRLYERPEAPLRRPAITFQDYVAAVARLRQSPEGAASREYWRHKLARLPNGPVFPGARPATSDRSERARLEATLAAWPALADRARALGVSPETVLVSAYVEVLSTWAEPGPFTVVVVDYERPPIHPEIDEVVGDFTFLRWLVHDPRAGCSFVEKVRRHERGIAEDRAHQLIGGFGILRELALRRPEQGARALPVVFTGFMPHADFRLPAGFRDAYGLSQTPQVVLDTAQVEVDGGLGYHWDAVQDHFPPGMVAEMFAGYGRLLQQLAASPEAWDRADLAAVIRQRAPESAPADLAGLTDEAWRERLERWNDTRAAYPEDRTLHRLIEEQVLRTPDLPAVQIDGRSLSYRELDEQANRCARFLRAHGVVPDQIVGVLMQRSLELVVALVAILKAGGAYLPLEPTYPEQRLEFMARDAGVAVLLAQSSFSGVLAGFTGTRLCLDTEASRLSSYSADSPRVEVRPEHLAYVIYTSGSTGMPKGCMLSHRAICNRLHWMQDAYALTPRDRVLQKTPFTFDVSVWEFFWPLITGARIVLAPPGAERDPATLAGVIQEHGVTACHFVPSMLRLFLDEPRAAGCASLRHVFFSGEALPYPIMERALSTFTAQLHNLYGPTEAAVDVSFWKCEARDDRKVPIGRPIANIRLYILDEQQRPVRPDQTGELYIAGVGLARGYLNRPELTAERFVRDPFDPSPGARMYKTGDRAAWLPDGNIDFLGRMDGQIKLRGLRIELGEIEAALLGHESVREAAVAVRDADSGDPRLVAYVVIRDGASFSPQAMRRSLESSLPRYMVPNQFVQVAGIPVTAHGKMDRAALPWPAQDDAAPAPPDVGALKEKMLRDIVALFELALGRKGLAPEADVFDLGATSLTLVRVSQKVREAFGVSLSVETILKRPTMAGIAASVAEQVAGAAAPQPAASPRSAAVPVVPVKPAPEPAPPARQAQNGSPRALAGQRLVDQLGAFFKEAMSVAHVDPHQDLFDLGATSFTLVRIAQRLREQLGLSLSVDVLLKRPTVAGIAAFLEERAAPAAPVEAVAAPEPPAAPGEAEPSAPALEKADFFSREKRDAFKQQKPHLRQQGEHRGVVALADDGISEADYRLRSCRTDFQDQPIPLADFSGLLGLLRQATIDGKPKHLYPSAGATYAVQTYLHVKEGAVEGLRPGIYYHHPERHELWLIDGNPSIERTVHFYYNRPHFDRSGFSLFFIAQLDAVEPVYGASANPFVLIETGCLIELLTLRQAEFGVGLLPVGAVDFDRIRPHFGLGPRHVFLLNVLGGRVVHEGALPRARQSGEGTPARAAVEALTARGAPAGALSVSASPGAGSRGAASAAWGTDIAIVGQSGRYPGASDAAALWERLRRGERSIRPAPADRWDPAPLQATEPDKGGIYCSSGGFLDDIDRFDCLLFRMSPAEARSIDPQERLFLEAAWACLESAGTTAERLNAQAGKVGVFVGVMWNDFQNEGVEGFREDRVARAVALHSSIANRVSHHFDFKGPSVAIDTSCSSAMTALHLACESIQRGECRAAIVGGVNLMAHPYHQGLLCSLRMVSESGFGDALGEDATGWIPGEGVGAVLIRPVDEAERSGDHIHALIKATAINHTGATPRYGMPSAEAQAASIRDVLRRAGLGPEAISYVEAAATGAAIADASEVAALIEVFGERQGSAPRVALGSIKPNIGHLESASAMSQLAKVLLQIQHRTLAPHVLRGALNPMIPWDTAPFWVPEQPTAWQPRSGPRRALVNAFGATGSLGHAVIEEYCAAERPAEEASGPHVVILSAATGDQLREYARRLEGSLAGPGAAPSLVGVAYTLQVGRRDMAERLAIIARDLDDLGAKLAAFAAGQAPLPEGVLTGSADGAPAPRPAAASDDPVALARQWVAGDAVDWSRCYRRPPRLVPLPTYPFGGQRLRVREISRASGAAPAPAPALAAAPAQAAAPARAQAAAPALAEASAAAPALAEASAAAPAPAPVTSAGSQAEDSLLDAVERWLVQLFASVAEIPARDVRAKTPLSDYGLNSLMAIGLHRLLSAEGLVGLPRTLFFHHRDLREVARHLVTSHGQALRQRFGLTGVEPSGAAAAPAPVAGAAVVASGPLSAAAGDDTAIAIIGVAGRYPGAEDLRELWQNLREGKDCITEIPADRWDHAAWYDPDRSKLGRIHNKWGGFLRGIDLFDPMFFRISPREAEFMDPQERLFLEVAWSTFEDAGYTRELLQRRHGGCVGVFAGVMYSEYPFYGVEATLRGRPVAVGLGYGSIANRVSFVMDLNGPSLSVDTLCSSSLTCLHLAVESLRRGECAMALAGGVNLSLHPNKYLQHSLFKMAAPDGRCRSFGEGGDGFTPGEGVGCVLLKPLSRALRDGDPIHGVIRGVAVNHGGRSTGYTVPSARAQAALIKAALARAGVPAGSIGYIEAHGTGTPLGDPIELEGLNEAFQGAAEPGFSCPIGSLKSNIGHLEAAAGVAGLTKVLLQMKHGEIAPSLHAEALNPNIDWKATPFFVQQRPAPWERATVEVDGRPQVLPRRAGISSFGAGGANAHVIVEEAPEVAPRPPHEGPQIFVLSAREEERLRAYAARIAAFLRGGDDVDLADLAYTLQVGREPMGERLALIAGDREALVRGLEAFAAGDDAAVLRGRARSDDRALLPGDDEDVRSLVAQWIGKGRLQQVARLWVAGAEIDWEALPRPFVCRRISLPTYPFARERYWLPLQDEPASAGAAAPSPAAVRGEERGAAALEAAPPHAGVFLEKVWRPSERVAGGAERPDGAVLVVAGRQTLALAEALRAGHGDVRVVLARDAAAGLPGGEMELDTGAPEQAAALAQALWNEHGGIAALIDLSDIHREPVARCALQLGKIAFVQRLLRLAVPGPFRLLHATRGRLPFRNEAPSLAGAAFAGLIGALGAEYRSVRARTVDLDERALSGAPLGELLWRELMADAPEGDACYRDGERFVARVSPVSSSDGPRGGDPIASAIAAGRPILVSGGMQGLGAEVARHLVRRGARRLALLGRKPLPPRERWRALVADPARDPLTAARAAFLLDLEASGAEVRTYLGPLTDREALQGFLGGLERDLGPLGGVVHCAGEMRTSTPAFIHKDIADVAAVLSPKVEGLQLLHELTSASPLDFFVTFSSVAALIPRLAAGILDYAAANAFMDVFAAQRAAAGEQHVRSIQWSRWQGGGMAGEGTRRFEEWDLPTYSTAEGLSLLDQAVRLHGAPCVFAGRKIPEKEVAERWLQVERPEPARAKQSTLGAAPAAPAARGGENGASHVAPRGGENGASHVAPRGGENGASHVAPRGGENGASRVAPRAGENGASRVLDGLRGVFSEELRIPVAKLGSDTPFEDFGVDSVILASLVQRIESWLGGVALEPTVLLQHRTLDDLARHLCNHFEAEISARRSPRPAAPDSVPAQAGAASAPLRAGAASAAPLRAGAASAAPLRDATAQSMPAPAEPVAVPARAPDAGSRASVGASSSGQTRIAVIGLACRFPGAPSPAAFWENLAAGVCSIREVPLSRWDWRRLYSPDQQEGKSVSKWGGFVDDIEGFDPGYFNIPEADAVMLDPLVRLFLEAGVTAFLDAGYDRQALGGRKVGVFVGARSANFAERSRHASKSSIVSGGQNFIAAHLSHALNLKGPSMVVDTACSSALVGISLACQSLASDACEMAVAGGVDVLLDEKPYLVLSVGRALSPDGKCHVFDEKANGFVPGEGAGAVILKRLDRALADGDRIEAVIEGIAVNNDGRTMGISTPNPEAQSAVIEEALSRAGAAAETLGYVEAHGTGTLIGDPIELRGLTQVFRRSTEERGFCAVGSVKTNIGHLLSAAGIASFIKVVLALRHRQIPPTLHCETPNPRFAFADSPFYPATRLDPWRPRGGVRRAGISSFGFGGTNAHAIVAELDPALAPPDQAGRRRLPPPAFNRRRFWPESPAAPSPPRATAAPARRDPTRFQLEFESADGAEPDARQPGRR
ncbi:amino acid adenylation domain-containing protein [Sorangium sp. So ce1151]|uniref:amino acid adenylation domain-containing protein n=1 Tax=Sorangium sp. So ce1151 TaxID=3133332 RepID=UPI003F5D841E